MFDFRVQTIGIRIEFLLDMFFEQVRKFKPLRGVMPHLNGLRL